jgi:hypothetical protein
LHGIADRVGRSFINRPIDPFVCVNIRRTWKKKNRKKKKRKKEEETISFRLDVLSSSLNIDPRGTAEKLARIKVG